VGGRARCRDVDPLVKRTSGVLVLAGFLAATAALPAWAADQEQQIGQQVYQQLLRKGEIIPNSPLYSTLAPIADRIKAVTDPQYQYPFHFILVHESSPNAFSVPGGNVYVTDSLMHFVDNQEELAGVLCHETSHAIHHDVVNLMRKDQNLEIVGTLAQIFLGRGSYLANSGIGMVAGLGEQNFSRSVETAADLKGSETCAQSGYNPYGMVWLFQKFAKSGKGGSLEMLSDHPRDDHRVSDLENHFRTNPALFGKYTNDIAKATPLKLPTPDARPQERTAPGGPPGGYNGPQGGYNGPPGGYGPPPAGSPTNGRPPAPTQTPTVAPS
jgi:predicted Zn-dependent protease